MNEATSQTIDAARRGDRAAQARLLTSLQDVWFRFCLSLLRDADEARDATQETALRFLRQLPGFRGESQLKTWSLSIATHVVREIERKRRAGRTEFDFLSVPLERSAGGYERAAHGESRQLLRAQLDHLPERQRKALVLRYFEELTVEQTAQAMGCAIGTVKATVHQALRALRTRMTQAK